MDQDRNAVDSIESLSATAKTVAGSLRDLRSAFAEVRERLEPHLSRSGARAKQAMRSSREYAREHPAALTLAVAGIGLVIGYLLWQRRGRTSGGTDYEI